MDLDVIQIRGSLFSRMECHGISRIPGSKALTKIDNRLRLVLWLKAHERTRHNT